MTKSQALVYSLLGITRDDIRPLACAVDIAMDLLFVQHVAIDDIRVMKKIYAAVAEQMNLTECAACRRIERVANKCWDEGDAKLLEKIIGRKLRRIPEPRNIIFYFAVYLRLGIPFFHALRVKKYRCLLM